MFSSTQFSQQHELQGADGDMVRVFIRTQTFTTEFTLSATYLRSNHATQKDGAENYCGAREENGVDFVERDLGHMEHRIL